MKFNCREYICKKQDNFQTEALGLLVPQPAAYTSLCGKKCDASYTLESLDTGKCYKYTKTVTSAANGATTAEAACKAASGGHLASIHSAMENKGTLIIIKINI